MHRTCLMKPDTRKLCKLGHSVRPDEIWINRRIIDDEKISILTLISL